MDGQTGFGACHYGYLPRRPSEYLRPFALRSAFPASDYYDRSVTLASRPVGNPVSLEVERLSVR